MGFFFGGAYFRRGLLLEGICFLKWVGLDNKTASTNSPWAYVWDGLLSEGFLRLGLFSGGLIYLFIYFIIFLWGGGGGGAYYRNFTVYLEISAACVRLGQFKIISPKTLISFS